MNVVSRVRAWSQEIERAIALGREKEWIEARVALEVWTFAKGDEKYFWDLLREPMPAGLGLQRNTAVKFRNRRDLALVIDDPAVWRAAGASGVKQIVALPKSKRKAAIKRVIDAAGGDRVKLQQVRVIVSHVGGRAAPSGKRPAAKPRAKPVAKPEEENAVPAAAADRAKRERDALLGDLRRLVDGMPLLRDLLSKEVRELLGAKPRKRSAS